VSKHPSLLPSSAEFTRTRVTGNREIAKNVFLLSLEKHFDFEPGQVVGIHTEPREDARLYSLAGGRDEPVIRILFNVFQQGELTPLLAKCREGDFLHVTSPFGWFTCNREPAWWIASGTGIAPFASMFFSGLGDKKILVHGGRNEESFYFSREFAGGMGDRYVRCCSGEKIGGLFHGRLTSYLENIDVLPADQTYYLCGRVEMVVEVRDILLKRGIPYHNILSEIYF